MYKKDVDFVSKSQSKAAIENKIHELHIHHIHVTSAGVET